MSDRIAVAGESIDYRALIGRLLDGGHTTGSIARMVGLSQPSVSRLYTGNVRETSGTAAVALIRAAGGHVSLPQD